MKGINLGTMVSRKIEILGLGGSVFFWDDPEKDRLIIPVQRNVWMFRCVRLGYKISKASASVSSGVPNAEKQMKARGRRPSVLLFRGTSFWYSFLNKLPTIIVSYLCFVLLIKQ